jgi:hypothetical protein
VSVIHPGLASRLRPVVVWGVWTMMLLVALVAIARYGPEIPRAEDWLLVAPLTGNEANLGRWLWEQNGEHRVPLPRLAYLALLKLTRADFRAGMVFNTFAIAGLAAAMMLAARRLRGRSSYADAFFPVAFLHLGHWDNLVWSWQIQFVLSTLFASAFLLIIVFRGANLTPLTGGLAGFCLVALPLCGANGLVLVPPFAAWLGFVAFRSWRLDAVPRARTVALILSVSVGVALVLTSVYFLGYERPSGYPANPGLGATAKIAASFLAMSFGPAAASWRALVVAILVVIAATTLLLAGEVRSGSVEGRRRALGLLCFTLAIVALALAVGWGRAGYLADRSLSRRYALLAVPVLCTAFFAWELHASRRWATRVQTAFLILAVALLPGNTLRGFATRNWVQAGMDAVRQDIRTGMPRPLLAERHGPFLLHWDGERLAAGMRMLDVAGIAPFVGLREDFAVEEIRVQPAGVTDNGGRVAVRLDGPRRVYAIRMPVAGAGSPTTTGVRIAWEGRERGTGLAPVPTSRPDEPEARTATVWINDVIDGFWIESAHPEALRDLRLALVTPHD